MTADEELPIEIKMRHDIETGVWPWEETGGKGKVGAAERIQQVQNLLDAVDRLTATCERTKAACLAGGKNLELAVANRDEWQSRVENLTAERDRLSEKMYEELERRASSAAMSGVKVERDELTAALAVAREENAKMTDQLVAAIRVVERYRASGVAPSNVMEKYDAALVSHTEPPTQEVEKS